MSDTEESKISTVEEREATAATAIEQADVLDALFEMLAGTRRSVRQRAAATIAIVATTNPELLASRTAALVEGAECPEGQTRWDCLNALGSLARASIDCGEYAVTVAEDNLFDDESGIVREAALRFLCAYGSVSPAASDAVWPSLDEAIQCYHGNAEFNDMLTWLTQFAQSDISDEASASLAARMQFDAEHANGTLRMRAQQIIEANKNRK